MILDYQSIGLDGVKIFEKVVFQAAGRQPKLLDNEACFMFVLEGKLSVRTPVDHFDVHKNEGFLTKCGEYFFEDLHLDPAQAERVEAIGIYFQPELVKQLIPYSYISYPQQLTQSIAVDFLLETYKNTLAHYLDHPQLFDREMRLLKVKELILLLAKSVQAPSFHHFISGLFEPQVHDFRQVIEQNAISSLSVAELAQLCHMSEATFKRHFKEIYGTSPAAYMRAQKLEKAKALLRATQLPINQIAFDCGFESPTSFNRAFKKAFNQSPSDYRLS